MTALPLSADIPARTDSAGGKSRLPITLPELSIRAGFLFRFQGAAPPEMAAIQIEDAACPIPMRLHDNSEAREQVAFTEKKWVRLTRVPLANFILRRMK